MEAVYRPANLGFSHRSIRGRHRRENVTRLRGYNQGTTPARTTVWYHTGHLRAATAELAGDRWPESRLPIHHYKYILYLELIIAPPLPVCCRHIRPVAVNRCLHTGAFASRKPMQATVRHRARNNVIGARVDKVARAL